MSMGNFLWGGRVQRDVMAASEKPAVPDRPVGVDHLTVVPTNFEPDGDRVDDRA